MKLLKHLRLPAVVAAALVTLTVLAVLWMTKTTTSDNGRIERELTPEEAAVRERLRSDVEFLASAPRNAVDAPEHADATLDYVERRFEELGYEVRRQPIETDEGTFHNLLVRIEGQQPEAGLVVLGAHIDTRGPTPGADDNASGVAALLDLARWLRDVRNDRPIELAIWTNEEPPYFRTEHMGSLVHARSLEDAGEEVTHMLSLEMLGYYDATPGSQRYPAVVAPFYPDHGAFIAFVGSMFERASVVGPTSVMRNETDFPTEMFAGPPDMAGIGHSDHWSFWQVGYPGAMVTDTAYNRTPHYHQYTDTPDTLDWERFARVTVALRAVVRDFTATD